MSRNAQLHEALLRLAAKFEYGELMAETQPAAFIDSVVERLGAMEAKLRKAEERAEKAERERDEARRRVREHSVAFHARSHGGLWMDCSNRSCLTDRAALGEKP